MHKTYVISSLDDLKEVASNFINEHKKHKIIAFYGEMGVGKTTFIKEICRNLGVENMVNSPTFSIINEYKTKDGDKIYHFDCYRIENINELIHIGYEEYFNSGNYCFIEWAEKIEPLLSDDVLRVEISLNEHNGSRIIKIKN